MPRRSGTERSALLDWLFLPGKGAQLQVLKVSLGGDSRVLPGGSEPPLLLLGHTDVVAAEPEHWTHPPFSGLLEGGYMWGRGALDMKNMVAVELMVTILLKRQGLRLNRDLLFAATADEEAGKGEHGPGWLLDHHPDAKGLNWSEPESLRKEPPVQRYISNRCLTDLGIGLEYPSFKEGML